MFKEKIRKRQWRGNYQERSRKTKQKNTKIRNLENGLQRKQNKQMPKWQLLNQMVKILSLQTT